MHIYLKNNPAKCLPDPIWNDGAKAILEHEQEQQQQDESSSWYKKEANELVTYVSDGVHYECT